MKLSTTAAALFAAGASARPRTRAAACKATEDFAGWSSMKYAFIFGDSYTQTGFNRSGIQPSPSNPLGNPPYPGWTASNGPNWVGYLTTKYNASLLQTFNLADGGATVDASLVAPWKPTVLSLQDQVWSGFFPYYALGRPAWTSADTLFAVWIGINDVGNSYYNGPAVTSVLNADIIAEYRGAVDGLYAAGGRNFVFLNVPPVERSPLILGQGQQAIDMEKADLAAFNGLVEEMAGAFKSENGDANVWIYDTNVVFGEVLDDPASYPQTAVYKNTTGFCEAYQNGTPEWTTFNPSCGMAVNEYFWLNSLHPTYPMHDVVAQGVSKALAAGPNVCPSPS